MGLNGAAKKYGFYATRYVQEADVEEAETKAVQVLREDDELVRALRNEGPDAPMIYLHEMAEFTSLEDIAAPGSGYSFYEDDAGGVKWGCTVDGYAGNGR